MKRMSPQSVALALAAPLTAAVFGLGISSLTLIITDHNPLNVFRAMWTYGTDINSLIEMVNLAVVYYLAALAVAITFKAGLFNIGVESQLRLGALFAAWIGAMYELPSVLHVLSILIIAASVGAFWAGIAAVLKVKRGVSEVITTIMLNSIGGALSAYLLSRHFAMVVEGSNDLTTKPLAESAHVPDLLPVLEFDGNVGHMHPLLCRTARRVSPPGSPCLPCYGAVGTVMDPDLMASAAAFTASRRPSDSRYPPDVDRPTPSFVRL